MSREAKTAKKIKTATTVFLTLVVFALFQTISPVFASWTYASPIPATPCAAEMALSLEPFSFEFGPYTPDAEDLQDTVNGIEVALGDSTSLFNDGTTATLLNFLKRNGRKDPYVSSFDYDFDTPDFRAKLGIPDNVDFLLTGDFKTPPTERYLYTTTVKVGIIGNRKANFVIPEGEPVYPVYRTKIEKIGGEWKITAAELGSAPASNFKTAKINSIAAFIDHNQWAPGKRGTNFDNAIHIGLNTQLYAIADNNAEEVYYKFVLNKGKTAKVTPSEEGILFQFSADDRVLQIPSSGFEFGVPGTYYFVFNGKKVMPFTIDIT